MTMIRAATAFLIGLSLAGQSALAQEGSAVAPSQSSVPSEASVPPSQAEMRRAEIDANAERVLESLLEASEAAAALYEESAGYAVFTAKKAGFIVTGGAGTGVAVDKQSGERTYMRMGTGGIGLGVGAQLYDVVILFDEPADLARFVTGRWDASATAHASAGKGGVTVTSSFIDGVAFFQLTDKGLMAQADISGTRFWTIDELN